MIYDEEVSAYDQPIKFIVGHAGTGKSTKLAGEADASTLVLTPTHKAKDVLLAKGLVNVITIHSLLKLVPTLDRDFRARGKMQRLKRIGDLDLAYISLVIIDEYSMIPTHIMDMLLSALPIHCKVTVFGDKSQLPPIDGQPIDPYDYTNDVTILTKQFRAEAPEVVETFERFVKYIETRDSRIDLRLNSAIEHGDLRDFNPDTDRILAFTNRRVIELNNKVAKGRDIDIGDSVLINSLTGTFIAFEDDYDIIFPSCISKGEIKLDKVPAIMRDIQKYGTDLSGYELVSVEIEEENYNIYMDKDHYAKNNAFKFEVEEIQLELIREHRLDKDVPLSKWCAQNRSEKHVRARGIAWSDYLAHSNLVFDLRRPYCTTVHKSQGSEFKTVYIDQDNMKKAIRGGDYMQYARIMYVALSRATERVIII